MLGIVRSRGRGVLAGILVFATGAAASAAEFEVDSTNYTTPLKLATPDRIPYFTDDHDLHGMRLAIDRQLDRFAKKKLTGTIRMGGKVYPLTRAKDSLEAFKGLIDAFHACLRANPADRCYVDLNASIRRRFDVYEPDLAPSDPRYGDENFAFFTGYHTHPIEARFSPEGAYQHAIYSNPKDSRLMKSRIEIDFEGALAGRGLETVYADFLFDVYLMHVAGSGKVTVTLPDGGKTQFYLQYDGTNKQRWSFLSPYMIQQGYITNPSVAAQRKFLRANPNKQREIFSVCPSYVFLRISQDPPKGSDSVAVTDNRTIATDSKLYAFKGLLTFVETQRPQETGNYDLEEEDKSRIPFRDFARFYLDQDTGGAIVGKARADLYFGSDTYSYFSAMNMEQVGKIHYLMLK